MRFRDALAAPGLGAIAEIKRRSPSLGDIRPNADPAQIAAGYERAGAAAISVLVDERFGGDWSDLRAARSSVATPLLAKGFFSTEEHLRTAKEAGADAVLLLLRDLDDGETTRLIALAEELELDTLVEAHDATELERAIALGAPVIGINARDLATFEIDRRTQLELVARIPSDRIAVAESGISQPRSGRGGRARRSRRDPRRLGADAGARPRREANGAALAPARQGLRLDARGGCRGGCGGGRRSGGFVLAKESPRRAHAVLDVPQTMLAVAVWVGEAGESPASLDQLYERDGDHRSRDAVLLRDDEQVGTVLDLPWQDDDSEHWRRAAEAEGRVMLAGGLAADNVRAAITAVEPWAVDASSRLELEPGIKDHGAVRAYVEAARG